MTLFLLGFVCGMVALAGGVSFAMAYTVADIESKRDGIED